MKIGILAYQSAINFGANLQIASTFGYLTNNGFNPVVIDYIPEDLRQFYSTSSSTQARVHSDFMREYCVLTKECHNSEELANVIKQANIDAVIIGSDAVAQHHPLIERIEFPTRRFFNVRKLTSDRMFPNPFWGTFADYLPLDYPMAILSASSQDSSYRWMGCRIRKEMRNRLNKMRFISARDTWTQSMYEYIYHGKRKVPVTPDPVFAFNQNVKNQPSEKEIREKFDLEKPYVLLSFLNSHTVSESWLHDFEILVEEKGIDCVALPFPSGIRFKHSLKKEISLPLSPIEWYCLIKYSAGYVGHNMHPIVVSLHNATPFFSFDNYGRRVNRYIVDESTSKIKHILTQADTINARISCCNSKFQSPAPGLVLERLCNFDFDKVKLFSNKQTDSYNDTMSQLLCSLF